MAEIVKPQALDDQALKSLQEVIDTLNTGVKGGNIAGPISAAKLRRVIVKKVAVGNAATKNVRHALGARPGFVFITMTSAGIIRKAMQEDENFVYLIADAANRTADICIVE